MTTMTIMILTRTEIAYNLTHFFSSFLCWAIAAVLLLTVCKLNKALLSLFRFCGTRSSARMSIYLTGFDWKCNAFKITEKRPKNDTEIWSNEKLDQLDWAHFQRFLRMNFGFFLTWNVQEDIKCVTFSFQTPHIRNVERVLRISLYSYGNLAKSIFNEKIYNKF